MARTLDRTQAPAIHTMESVVLPKPNKYKLSNGCALYVLNRGAIPAGSLQLVYPIYETEGIGVLETGFMARLLTEGTSKLSAHQIHSYFDGLAVQIQTSASADYLTINLQGLPYQMILALEKLIELLNDPIFPEKELKTHQQISLQQIQVNERKTSYLASKQFRSQMFGENHPYGFNQNSDAVNSVSRVKLQKQYQQKLQYKPFTAYLSGSFEGVELEQIKALIDSFEVREQKINQKGLVDIGFEKNEFHTSLDWAQQTSLRIGKPAMNMLDPSYPVFFVMNELYGGFFGSRLMKNLREDKGLTYGIYSSLVIQKYTATFIVGSDVKKSDYKLAIDEIQKEMKKLHENKVTEQELELVKNHIGGSFIKSIQSPMAIMNLHRKIHQYGLTEDWYDDYLDKIKNVSAEELMNLAKTYFDDQFLIVSVG